MMVFVPLVLGLSPGLVFPLKVENDESVEPTAEIWVVAIFERRFCWSLPVDGADKSDELASGFGGGAAGSSMEECGPLTPGTPGPCSRDPLAAGLIWPRVPPPRLATDFSLTGLAEAMEFWVFLSGTGTFWKELIFVEESVF